jgi:hypothetical protein
MPQLVFDQTGHIARGFSRIIRIFLSAGVEPAFWLAALVWLALIDPAGPHFTLCPLTNLGVTWCPGCGLGHAVSYALHGEFSNSLHAHFLGIPAVLVLLTRIATLMHEAQIRSLTLDHSHSCQDISHD